MIVGLILLALHIWLSIWCGDYWQKHQLPWIVGFLLSLFAPLVGTILVILTPYIINKLAK